MHRYLIVLMALLSLTADAQDTIYYKHRPPNIVHVTSIIQTKILFTHIHAKNGPVYKVHTRDVAKVVSENGVILFMDTLNWDAGGQATARLTATPDINIRRHYPGTLLTIIPAAVLAADKLSAGISYERILDRSGKFAIRIPAFITTRHVSGYLMPAVRIYPFGQRVGSVFISPGLFTAYGERSIRRDSLRNLNGGYGPYNQVVTEWQVGFYCDAGINLHLSENLFVTLTAGSGLNYLDLTKGGDYIFPAQGKIEFGFGYRFDKKK